MKSQLVETTNVYWPDSLKPKEEYDSEEDARADASRIAADYAAKHGSAGGPSYRVVEVDD